ncbi:probable ATP-dependent RNA helicase DDX52 isoform X2 [Corticium candelabrum]|uniref:probable ATP-dependent RNA helicase DDX52 isoform X2 n=1 Tax=Corticium candelabrum TaxID=121492 RepID=UPI002E26F63B|nr:probable ATP-dependent RNA helicase DDX52 isoform X2 [Corticium candelabrum]
MADCFDLFRRLRAGAVFDKTRFCEHINIAEGLAVGQKRDRKGKTQDDIEKSLDFFSERVLSGASDVKTAKTNSRKKRDVETVAAVELEKPKEIVADRRGTKRKTNESVTKTSRKNRKTHDKEQENACSDMESLQQMEVTEPKIFSDSVVAQSENKLDKKKSRQKKRKITAEMQKKLEMANAFRNEHHIYIKGADVPEPITSFHQLQDVYSVQSYVLKNVIESGYFEPTPIQMQAIPLMMHKREILGCAPTGSGKTAAFLLPIFVHLKKPQKQGFRALIVSPTRELAQQIYRESCRLANGSGFRIHVLTKAKASANNFNEQSSQRFDILVSTPNRLVHLLEQDPPGICLSQVEWLILDEADKLFEDGKDGFRDQVATIFSVCDKIDVCRGLFSATLSNGIEEWCHAHLDNHVRVIVGQRNAATETVKQRLVFVGEEGGKLIAIRDIIREGFRPPMLVFVQSKERAKDLFHELIYDGLNVDVIHADRTQAQRDNVVRCFRVGKVWILICTELMGRGIDFKGVSMVVNYDFPTSAVSYIHRIGRTGRAGHVGEAITFFTKEDLGNLRSIVNVMRSSGCEVPQWMLELKKPGKKKRRQLAKKPVERLTIKTASKYDIQMAKKKMELIAASKRRKKALSASVCDN